MLANKLAKKIPWLGAWVCLLWLNTTAFGDSTLPGISETEIRFVQSACFSGPNLDLGCRYHAGIRAAFDEQNRVGGAHGRILTLSTLDDGYESDHAADNARQIVSEQSALAVIGGVGTPTARRMVPILRDAAIPVIGLYTGADFLYDFKRYPNVVNIRAGYADETELLVEHMYQELGKRRFGVIYQDDSFGRLVLQSYKAALARRGLSIFAKSTYTRNTHAFHSALFVLAPAELDALLIVGSYAVNGELIGLVNSLQRDYVVANVSFVGSGELDKQVKVIRDKVLISEVMPDPLDTSIELVERFHAAMESATTHLPETCPPIGSVGATSLEGYALGRFIIAVLERIPEDSEITRELLLKHALSTEPMDLGGWHIAFEEGSNAGSHYVRLLKLSDIDSMPKADLDESI